MDLLIESIRKQEIQSKAKEVNNLSEQFQLIHATYAVQEYITTTVKNYYKEKLNELSKRIEEKMKKELDSDDEFKEKEVLTNLINRNRPVIDIGYIQIDNPKTARVVKTEKSFTIYLARSLRDSIFNEDGTYNYKTIHTIRHLMAHELGHLVLHTQDLLIEESLQGSLTIRDDVKEAEANLFGDELLFLRKERNKTINKDGGAANLF